MKLCLKTLVSVLAVIAGSESLIHPALKSSLRIRGYNEHILVRKSVHSEHCGGIGGNLITNTSIPRTGVEKHLFYAYLPVFQKNELIKFVGLSSMMFWIVFVFTLTRDIKDALIVVNCGAETISFLKVYGVIPATAAFMYAYTSYASRLSSSSLVYATIAPFFLFYFLFAFWVYPFRNLLHPVSWKVPSGGTAFIVNALRFWTFSVYFIVSELWGSASIPLVFWSFANSVMNFDQAKRMYPLISLVGNLGPILSGTVMSYTSKLMVKKYPGREEMAFQASLQVLSLLMLAAGAFIVAAFRIVQHQDCQEKSDLMANKSGVQIKCTSHKLDPSGLKRSTSFMDSLRLIGSDPYLRDVSFMVLGYGICMEFTELMWKSVLKEAFPIKSEYFAFMGSYSTYVGFAAALMTLVGSSLLKRFGWQGGALLTPIVIGALSLPFSLSCVLLSKFSGKRVLMTAVYVGMIQVIFSKASKYAVFDPTKEMAYIPLDPESKTNGKAAIDVFGARLGKSGGAIIQQIVILMFGNIIRGAPAITIFLFIAISIWIGAILDLTPRFKQRNDEFHNHKIKL